MKARNLIAQLMQIDKDATILVSSDEELNTLYKDVQIAKLSDMPNTYVIWGNSGSEI